MSEAAFKNNKILIVDDAQHNLDLYSDILGDEYTIDTALNGDIAISKHTNNTSYERVIMDVKMPGMDGYETCRKIKDISNGDCDVVFISGLDSTAEIITGYEAGDSDFIVKPIPDIELLQKVSRISQ